MGSRKKVKKELDKKHGFLQFYRSLNIDDKIAFKSFFYHYGRNRLTLKDLLSYPYFWQIGPLARKNAIIDGYSWLFG